jgi:hypothetical protein
MVLGEQLREASQPRPTKFSIHQNSYTNII